MYMYYLQGKERCYHMNSPSVNDWLVVTVCYRTRTLISYFNISKILITYIYIFLDKDSTIIILRTHLVQPLEFRLHSPIITELPICNILSQISEIALLQCYQLTTLEKSPLWSPLCFQISPFSFFILKIMGFPAARQP